MTRILRRERSKLIDVLGDQFEAQVEKVSKAANELCVPRQMPSKILLQTGKKLRLERSR
jgi:hypothetical protein